MKKNLFILMMIATSVGFWASCKDKEDEKVTADIMFEEPTEGASFAQGDTVMVHAMVTGSAALHGWELEIRKKDDQTVVYSTDAHDHAATYHIHGEWVNNVSSATQMEAVVTVTVNHDGETAVKSMNFSCQP
ncbi:MAG: hypothetical protein IBJ09_10820 [Bacteroidia bacterium]|nr:hypothetical protein [Bacteroidia bacterium]